MSVRVSHICLSSRKIHGFEFRIGGQRVPGSLIGKITRESTLGLQVRILSRESDLGSLTERLKDPDFYSGEAQAPLWVRIPRLPPTYEKELSVVSSRQHLPGGNYVTHSSHSCSNLSHLRCNQHHQRGASPRNHPRRCRVASRWWWPRRTAVTSFPGRANW